MRHELKSLALVPQDLRCLRDWRLRQARDHAALLDCHRTRGSNHALLFLFEDNPANLRLKVGFVPHELLLQVFPREFERHKLMMIVRATRRWQRLVPNRVVTGITGCVITVRFLGRSDLAVAVEIQTKLKGPRMKTFSPIE